MGISLFFITHITGIDIFSSSTSHILLLIFNLSIKPQSVSETERRTTAHSDLSFPFHSQKTIHLNIPEYFHFVKHYVANGKGQG